MPTTKTKSVDSKAVQIERIIPAHPAEVFDAWLNPHVPGAFGHEHEELIVELKPDGLWFWRSIGGTPHYGRFLEITRPVRLHHSWMSPNTLGQESIVTVSFQARETGTLMTIIHAGLPNSEMAMAHDAGWSAILDRFCVGCGSGE